MKLDAYPTATLQHAAGLGRTALAEGILDLAAHVAEIEAEINTRYPVAAVPQQKRRVRDDICPSCQKGRLLPLATIDGLLRVGCGKCRYSRVVE